MRTNKQMITRTTDNRGVRWVRERYLCFVTFSSPKLSLYEKKLERAERAEREREIFLKKNVKRVASNNKQHRERNS